MLNKSISIFFFLFYVLSISSNKLFFVLTKGALKRTCANTKSISPYFYIMPAVHKNRNKSIRYIKLINIHEHHCNRPTKEIAPKRTKKLEPGPWLVHLKRAVYMMGGSKVTVILILKKIQECQRSLYPKFKRALKCELCWSEVLRGWSVMEFPFLQKDEERNERNGPQQTIEHVAAIKRNVSS